MDSSSSKLVWYPDGDHGYAIGKIVDIGQTNISLEPVANPSQDSARFVAVESADGARQFAYKSVYPCEHFDLERRPEEAGEVDDNCALINLNEAALLENIRVRFFRDKIYTYVAHILVAVNPYFTIKGLHSPETIERYQGKSLGTLPPHVYAIADKAFRDMKAFKQSQSIIINGESGAGKTESQKYVLRYLCLSGSQSGRLEKLILDANPLLEAFGNAKTIRNNNSSRFGKFIEIHYSDKFQVSGGLFLHYLLEKSRICSQSAGERNYHIFYQLCACLPDEQWRSLALGPPDRFRYLSGGCTQYFSSRQADATLEPARKSRAHLAEGAIQDQLIDDLRCYEQTDRALSNFGVSEQQKRQLYSIVAAVLHLGNIGFADDPDDHRGGCRVDSGEAERALERTAGLMGVDCDHLRESLVTRVMSTSRAGHKGTVYKVQLNRQQAQAARDALAKAIYSRLFDHIVARIVNRSIPFSSSAYYIGVLDVAGFEYFQHNGFEQLLINFCNERLQQFFNERILREEQTIYDKEGLNVGRVDYVDNQDCIQLFEAKSSGIFDLLDEQSRLPRPSAEHFTQSVHEANKGHFRIAVPRASKLRAHRDIRDHEGFLVRHFAGAVCYETGSFIEKNNDALHDSLRSLMLDASHTLLRDLFSRPTQPASASQLVQQAAAQSAASSSKLNFISVTGTFRAQLSELMHKLRSTGSHFIRCVKPNSAMVAHKFQGGQILSQLHCSGMNSVLELMQQGYPSRSSFNDLYASYRALLPVQLARLDSQLFCRALFKALGLSERDFRFGASKVFFRPGKFAQFDQIVRSDKEQISRLVLRVASWLLRARWRKAQYCCLSAVKLQRKILYRRALVMRLQRNWRAALVGGQVRFRLSAIRAARKAELSVREFQQIAREQLDRSPADQQLLREQSDLLLDELAEFVGQLGRQVRLAVGDHDQDQAHDNNNLKSGARESLGQARAACTARLETLTTKRDLLIRSIKDKIAKHRELLELERKVAQERQEREHEQLASLRDLQLKQRRNELELRRQLELQQLVEEEEKEKEEEQQQQRQQQRQQTAAPGTARVANGALESSIGLHEEQEQRDYDIARQLAQERGLDTAPGPQRTYLAPSENYATIQANPNANKFDLTKWKYSDLRDTINTSCDLELLDACKREFHRRLKVYHAWRAANSRPTSARDLRAPSSLWESQPAGAQSASESSTGQSCATVATTHEQRFFRIPFVKSSTNTGRRGWWFAHFDGQWIARQLEIHPDRAPILLVAGRDDIEMCELSLKETRLTSKRGAEILPQEFEEEWTKHGGQPYVKKQSG